MSIAGRPGVYTRGSVFKLNSQESHSGGIMKFISILFATLDENRKHKINTRQPEHFVDLNLDKVVTAVVKGREEYDISHFFYTPLEYPEDIYYRQGVIQDMAKDNIYNALVEFSAAMQKIREIGAEGKSLLPLPATAMGSGVYFAVLSRRDRVT